eukprot:259009_1
MSLLNEADEEEEAIHDLLEKDDRHRMQMQEIPQPHHKAKKLKILIFLCCSYIFIILVIGICYYFTNIKEVFYGIATIFGILLSSYYGKNLYFKSVELRSDIQILSELRVNKSSLRHKRRNTLKNDIDTLSAMNNSLRDYIQTHIHDSVKQNKVTLGKFRQLEVNMKATGDQNINLVRRILNKNKNIENQFSAQTISQERNMLNIIFDRFELEDNKMTKETFEHEFMSLLTAEYQYRFKRLGSFDQLSQNVGLDFDAFQMALDIFAEISRDTDDVDYEFKPQVVLERAITHTDLLETDDKKENEVDQVTKSEPKTDDIIQQLRKEASRFDFKRFDTLPLHQYSEQDIIDKIAFWFLNDINVFKYFPQVAKKLALYTLSGEHIAKFGLNIFKAIAEKEFSGFISVETFKIILNRLNAWRDENPDALKTKTADEIGLQLF